MARRLVVMMFGSAFLVILGKVAPMTLIVSAFLARFLVFKISGGTIPVSLIDQAIAPAALLLGCGSLLFLEGMEMAESYREDLHEGGFQFIEDNGVSPVVAEILPRTSAMILAGGILTCLAGGTFFLMISPGSFEDISFRAVTLRHMFTAAGAGAMTGGLLAGTAYAAGRFTVEREPGVASRRMLYLGIPVLLAFTWGVA